MGTWPASVEAAGGESELVSRANGAHGEPGNGIAHEPAISANGRYVAFVSSATNLDPVAAVQATAQVYVRDLRRQRTILVSRGTGGESEAGNFLSMDPAISADGRYVTFTSQARNLIPGVSGQQVYLRDLQAQTTVLVSRGAGPSGEPANQNAGLSTISADGRFVLFNSAATNIHPEGPDEPQGPFGLPGQSRPGPHIYLRDMATGVLEIAVREPSGNPYGGVDDPTLAPDAPAVAFGAFALPGFARFNGDYPGLFVRDLTTGQIRLVSRGRHGKRAGAQYFNSISRDGTRIPFVAEANKLVANDGDDEYDTFVRDTERDRTLLASRGYAVNRRDTATRGVISGNGRVVAFVVTSETSGEQRNPGRGLFARDLTSKTTIHAPGTPGPGTSNSLRAVLSGNGRIIAFSSNSPRLSGDDRDRSSDIFVFRLGG